MPVPTRSVRALSAGAALVTCSLASAQALISSTIDSASGFLSLGSTTGTFSYTGPAAAMSVALSIGAGSGSGSAVAYGFPAGLPGFDVDVFTAAINTSSSYTSGVSSVSFTVTLSRAVYFLDLGVLTSFPGSWTLNSVPLTDGDIISAGQHTIVGSMIYGGPSISAYTFGFGLATPASSGVPLPGAAGLAAVGLAGLSRRRRR